MPLITQLHGAITIHIYYSDHLPRDPDQYRYGERYDGLRFPSRRNREGIAEFRRSTADRIGALLDTVPGRHEARKGLPMKQPPATIKERLVESVDPIRGGFLLVRWETGAIGLVDLRSMIEQLPVFEFLKDTDAFKEVKVADDGTAIYWTDPEGDIIDIDSDSLWLRRKPIAARPAKPALKPQTDLVARSA
jgi:hypothetical protein